MKMPFGKYKNSHVDELPDGYLSWLWENVELREPLFDAVRRELIQRDREASCRVHSAPAKVDTGRIKQIYRTLAVKWHPDRGGTKEAMQAVNEFYEELKQI
jgi:hypothetical protein